MILFDRYYEPDLKKYVYILFGFKYFSKTKFQRIQERARRYNRKLENLHTYVQGSVDITKLSPATGVLREIQLECLELLKVFDDVCKTSNLEYWIDFGTLIGAIRHGGFVPWDNDIDVSMPRQSFEKVADLLQERLKDTDYQVRTAGYTNHFQIRICNKDNTIGLDIFSVDFYDTMEDKSVVNLKVKEARKQLEILYRKKDGPVVFDIPSIRRDVHEITGKYICSSPKDGGNKFVFYGIEYRHTHELVTFEYQKIFPLQTIEFEGLKLPCPNLSREFLTDLYGDYMGFPKDYEILRNVLKSVSPK